MFDMELSYEALCSFEDACAKAIAISETHSVVQHVNMRCRLFGSTLRVGFYASDWCDGDATIRTYSNGHELI